MSTSEQRPRTSTGGSFTASGETTRVRGEALTAKVKELIHEGNVRRISVRNDEGHTVIEIPVTAGVIAAVVAPVLVAVAALAAFAGSWEIEVDRAPGDVVATDGVHVTGIVSSRAAGRA